MNYNVKKIKKLKNSLYEIDLEKKQIVLYEEIVIKYDLLLKKTISDYILKKIVIANNKIECYQQSLDFLEKKKKTEYEVVTYLKEKNFDEETIKETIERLRSLKLVDDLDYAKRYINYVVSYRLTGPRKIRKTLLTHGISEDLSNSILTKYADEVWYDKIRTIINKKLEKDKRRSNLEFRQNMLAELVYYGYPKIYVVHVLKDMDTDHDKEAIKNQFEFLYKKYVRKYEGHELKFHLKRRLSEDGFNYGDIKEVMDDFFGE